MRLHVLYISDNLGAPGHQRGIFVYSLALLRMLKELGASVCLILEGGAVSRRNLGVVHQLPPRAADILRAAAIYRYFDEHELEYRFRYGRYGRRVSTLR